MQAQTKAGLATMLSGPAAVLVALPLAEAGYKDLAAVLIFFWRVSGLWLAIIGYRVLRGGIALSDALGHLRAIVVTIVGIFIATWFAQPR